MPENKSVGAQIVNERESVYGDVTDYSIRVAQVWSGILGHEVKPVQVPIMMAGLKLVRWSNTPDYSDNPDDAEGYIDMGRTVVGDDMIEARSVSEYLEKKTASLFVEARQPAPIIPMGEYRP